MRKRSILISPRLEDFRKKRRRKFVKKALVFFVLFLILFVGLGKLSAWQKINIENIEVSGNRVVDESEIEALARGGISGYYFWLYPKSNFLIYPKRQIARAITENFKTIKNVAIKLSGNQTILIAVSEREPKYTWCGDLPPDAGTNTPCYFMDDTGFIFAHAPFFSGDVYFRFFGSVAETTPLGEYFTEGNLSKLVSFRSAVESFNLTPSFIVVGRDGDAELYLARNAKGNAPKIIFKPNGDIEKAVENLKAVLESEDIKEKLSTLEYIDLRYGNKVYFK